MTCYTAKFSRKDPPYRTPASKLRYVVTRVWGFPPIDWKMAAKAFACSCYRSAVASPQLSATVNAVRSAIETLNTSTVDGLSGLPCVGSTTARRVVEARNAMKEGQFTDLKQVLAIPRCGRRVLTQLISEEELVKYHKLCCRVDTILKVDGGSDSVCACSTHPVCSPEVVSVDLGLSNAAWVHLNLNMEVIQWQKLSITFPDPYNVEAAHTSVRDPVSWCSAVKYH